MARIAGGPDLAGRVLVVDDEPTLRETVGYNLLRAGLEVELAEDGPMALAAVRARPPDLVVLDVMLPGMDGFQVLRSLREESTVPVLLLSARGAEHDRVHGLELGADDYLTKPFAMRELLARVRAMLRRADMAAVVRTNQGPSLPDGDGQHDNEAGLPREGGIRPLGDRGVLRYGQLLIDPARRQARVGEAVVPLRPKEFDLLHYLVRQPGIVLSREAILREVWGYHYPVDTRTVDVHVRWLRQKIEEDPSQPRMIETVRGFGYRFVAST